VVNRKPVPKIPLADFDRVMPFTDLQADLVASIASQAAVALENHRLYADIRQLFDGFITAAVSVIEARDPSTAGHSQRVSDLTVALARACQDCTEGPFLRVQFSSEELEELRYASLLHDFGKVGVKEEILLKANKLFPHELERLEWRFRIASMQAMLESMSMEMQDYPLGSKLQSLDADLNLIRRLNQSGYRYSQREADALKRIAERWFLEEDQEPVVAPTVINRLCIPAGSLDPMERREIQRHVEHTYNFLKVIPWTENLRRVPEIAFAHHEKLDGSGYPLGLVDEEIPFGAKLMTISDIFDALTAGDRPYKSGMGPRRALFILREEAAKGRLNGDAVELFAAKQIWASVIY
jgi:HD-GYP domain-containing protein (c-di-GMP phosphodiesterase class II)